jgi:hypothetical protein
MNSRLTGSRRRARLAIAAAILLALASGASAQELEYRLSLGGGHSDNIRRTATNEIDEDIASAGLQFSYDARTPRVEADVVGDIAYYDYLDDTYDSEVVGNVYGDAGFAIVPERFIWALSDQFGQVRIDPFLPATADNRENINYFTTGPDLFIGLGSQMRLQLGGRYVSTTYEDSDLDSTTTLGHLALIRLLSDRSQVSLNGRVEQIEYDQSELNADFDDTEAYLRYEVEGARTNLAVDLGYSKLDRDAVEESESGTLVRLELSRRMSGSSTIALSGGREFSTSARAFAAGQGISNTGLGTAPGIQTAEPFTLDYGTIGYTFNRNRTGIAATVSWSKRSYDNNPALDQSLATYAAQYRRELSQRTSLEVGATLTSVKYEPPAADYDELTAGVRFSWRLSQSVSMDLTYDYSHSSSDASASEYTENRLWLTIGYGRGDPRVTRVSPMFGIDSQTTTGN